MHMRMHMQCMRSSDTCRWEQLACLLPRSQHAPWTRSGLGMVKVSEAPTENESEREIVRIIDVVVVVDEKLAVVACE